MSNEFNMWSFLDLLRAVLSVQVSRERTRCGWVESQFKSAGSMCTCGSMLWHWLSMVTQPTFCICPEFYLL